MSRSSRSAHGKTRAPIWLAALGLATACATAPNVELADRRHPLDALTDGEIAEALSLLGEAGLRGEWRVQRLDLNEPAKAQMLAWRAGDPVPRAAFAVLKRGGQTVEAVVDLAGRTVTQNDIPGVQPGLLPEEYGRARAIVVENGAWQEAMAARGLDDYDDVSCFSLTVGTFDADAGDGRLVRVQCRLATGTRINPYARPISGLTAIVDLNENSVVRVIDTGPVPVPARTHKFAAPGARPSRLAQTPTFSVDGNLVEWGDWSFHTRMDSRVGLVLSLVRFRDRSVLYQGTLSETFIPYMDPSEEWYWRTFLDSAEYGFGLNASALTPGVDCPLGARFDDAVMAWPGDGEPTRFDGVVCLFERDTGTALWRHTEAQANARAGLARIELVLRQTSQLGLYDYTVDWVFSQAGELRIDVGASGVPNVKAVTVARGDEDAAAGATRYGALVAPNLVAPNHDHYFNFRLDLDVDGTRNTFVRGAIVVEAPQGAAGRSLWRVEDRIAATESAAKLTIDLQKPSIWKVINPGRANALGLPTGYRLVPAANISPLVPAGDPGLARGPFAAHHLWVTPYRADERYAAGDYPNQSAGGGLPAWTASDRPIENRDLVLWYTVGFRHVTVAEDWPILTTRWRSFALVPFNFFDGNATAR